MKIGLNAAKFKSNHELIFIYIMSIEIILISIDFIILLILSIYLKFQTYFRMSLHLMTY